MITQKYITKIIAAVMAAAVGLCLAAAIFAEPLTESFGGNGIAAEYESKLFDTDEILNIDIRMEEADWNDMLSDAISETYRPCDVEINGELFYRVGIRPKGNTSLTSIASDPETDRYSFKLEFNQYVEGQSCYGLDKLVLNNNYADATNMKEAFVYDMYRYLDTDASLYNYAKISVNGEYWGVYLALEAVEDSFLLRNYGVKNGELYKPDSMNLGGGKKDFEKRTPPDAPDGSETVPGQFQNQTPAENKLASSDTEGQSPGAGSESDGELQETGSESGKELRGTGSESGGELQETGSESGEESRMKGRKDGGFPGGGGFGGFSMGGSGANLNYTDDDLDSYSAIWDGEVTDSGKADHRRVVTALKHISEGTSLETYMDVENLLKYMAVHVVSVNEDSLSGMMAHNYYLYEADGRLNILPWDYNLALGGMGGMGGRDGGNGATGVVNDAIDNAFSGTKFFDTLMENEAYREKYYGYLKQLSEEYISGGGFDAFYNRVRSQIDSLVESDPTAFYSYEEYEKAADTLYEVVCLRGQSIKGQIEGSIPSESGEQNDSDALVDASHLDLSVMGSMSMGDRMREWKDSDGDGSGDAAQVLEDGMTGGTGAAQAGENGTSEGLNPPPSGENGTSEGLNPPPSGENGMPEGFDPPQAGEGGMPEGFDPSQLRENGIPEGFEPSKPASGGQGGSDITGGLALYGACLVVMALSFLFAKRYRRRIVK